MSHYRQALICLNGHCISYSIDDHPEHNAPFCSKCGAETIRVCPNCQTKIRGDYYVEGYTDFREFKPPAYCHNCGKPFPWTEKALTCAKELIYEDEQLTNQQKEDLINVLPDVIVETPRTNLAVIRIKKCLLIAGKYTAEGVRQFSIDFACELAKKQLGL